MAPDGGSIHLNGVDVVCRSSYARQSVAVVFEEADNSYSYLTVRENLLYFGLLNRLSMAEAKQKADKLLDLFGLSEHAHRLTQTLSRGMKQKLAFSIALMKGAPLLFLDEPTLGLDVESQRQMRHLLMEKSEWWNTVLITTHDIPFAHAVGERFLFMKNGEIIWEGTKDRFATPDDLETAFLSAIGVGSRA
ncbi:ABC transporter ATP-binding protein [Geobacillus stearothermophilus]|nr:ABC transporter ATP-binding protein [Geobacillus stearothermophilus]